MRRTPYKISPLYFLLLLLMVFLLIFLPGSKASWSQEEKSVIKGEGVMRVLTIDDKKDSLFLRTTCKNLTLKEIQSPEYTALAERMLGHVLARLHAQTVIRRTDGNHKRDDARLHRSGDYAFEECLALLRNRVGRPERAYRQDNACRL